MRIPSVKKLRECFGANARKARKILEMTRAELRAHPDVVLAYHGELCATDTRFHLLNQLEDDEGKRYCGDETFTLGDGSEVRYLNGGDCYVATVYFRNGNYHVGDIGYLIERHGTKDVNSF